MEIKKILRNLGLAAAVAAVPIGVRSCSIAQSNRPYLQGEYKGVDYSFAKNGLTGKTYTITTKDGTVLRCDDMNTDSRNSIIDSVIVYGKDGKKVKVYENSLSRLRNDENDKLLSELTSQVKEAEKAILEAGAKQREEERSNLLGKIKQGE